MKTYKHKITGDIAQQMTGENSNFYSIQTEVLPKRFVERSNDWEELSEYSVGEKTKEEIMQECIKRFPKGSKVKCAFDRRIYTIAQVFMPPEENNWFEGVYYYGSDNDILAIMEEKKSTGFYLFYQGKYAELIEEYKKEYEILSLINTGNNVIFYKVKDGLYSSNMNANYGTYEEKELLDMSHFKIYSVRRIKDGEVFAIGDRIKIKSIMSPCYEETVIDDFKFWLEQINNIQKLKPVLFTTEDGVDIRKGDEVFILQLEGFKLSTLKHIADENWDTGYDPNYTKKYKRFSSKEKAEEYVVMNKPCLSINDVLNNYGTTQYSTERLIQLVKSKLNKK